jgi:acyl-CoA synthetase (AMP-forming)/AMP-acid ligase II
MILVGGSNVYPAEVEAALDEHPQIASSAVIGLPDEDLGHRYQSILDARDALDVGNNTDALLAACDHAQQDVEAKREAMKYLRQHVPMKHVEEIAQLLSTSQMKVTADVGTYVSVDD